MRARALLLFVCGLAVILPCIRANAVAQEGQNTVGLEGGATLEETREDALYREGLELGEEDGAQSKESSGFESEPSAVQRLIESMSRRLARERNQEGLEALAEDPPDLPAALDSFQQAYTLTPEDVEIAANLGFVYGELGNLERAEPLLREALRNNPLRLVTYLNLSDVLSARRTDRALEEAAQLLVRARELGGNDYRVILRQARVARRQSNEQAALRFFQQAARLRPDAELFIEIGDYLRELAREDDAASWYRRVPEDDEQHELAQSRLEQLAVERQARRYGWSPSSEEPSDRARSLVRRAESLLAHGQIEDAEALARQVAIEEPLYAEAHRVVGDALAATGRQEQALAAHLRGFAMEPSNPAIIVRIARAYLRLKPPRREEAIMLLTRVLQLRPDWQHLRLELALAQRAAGDLPAAWRAVSSYLAAQPDAAEGDSNLIARARALERELSALLQPTEQKTEKARAAAAIADCLNRARVWLQRGQTQAALDALDCGAQPEVLRLRARILKAAGRPADAERVLKELLDAHPADVRGHYELGQLLLRRGSTALARDHFEAAEEAGIDDATYQIAVLDYERGRAHGWPWPSSVVSLWKSRERLRRYIGRPDPTFGEHASSILSAIERTTWRSGSTALGLVAVLGIGAVVWLRRRRAGMSLSAFVRSHPEAGVEVQHVLAAIRHEVLKHHSTALRGIVAAMERGETPNEDLSRFAGAVFGTDEHPGVATKLDGYVRDLTHIGRRFDARLSLDERDAVVGALIRGFDVLRAQRDAIENPRQDPRHLLELKRHLQRASERLNVGAYRAIDGLIADLRKLRVDAPLLSSAFERARHESSFVGEDFEALQIIEESRLPRDIMMPRDAFDDVLINLIRNAIRASLRDRSVPVRIGVRVRIEIDAVTGEHFLALAVLDTAKDMLDHAQINAAPLESGLGIVRERVARNDGSVHVVDPPDGWVKAIEVWLPLAEETTGDEQQQAGET